MDDLTPPGGLWAGLGVAITGVVGGAFWLIQKISSGSVDRAGDRAEVNIIAVLQEERDKWRELYAASEAEKRQYYQQFMESSSQVTLLTERVTALTDTVNRQSQMIESLNTEVARLNRALEEKR